MAEHASDLERNNRIPRLFLIFYLALAGWGIWYIAAYTPALSGWSFNERFEREMKEEAKAAAAASVPHENPYEADPKAVAEGEVLYGEHCAPCHGKDLKGGAGADLTDHLAYGEDDGSMYASVAAGRPGGMPAFGTSLGRDRIWRVLAYVDSVREHPKGR